MKMTSQEKEGKTNYTLEMNEKELVICLGVRVQSIMENINVPIPSELVLFMLIADNSPNLDVLVKGLTTSDASLSLMIVELRRMGKAKVEQILAEIKTEMERKQPHERV